MNQDEFDRMLAESPTMKALLAEIEDMKERLCWNEVRARQAYGDAGRAMRAISASASGGPATPA